MKEYLFFLFVVVEKRNANFIGKTRRRENMNGTDMVLGSSQSIFDLMPTFLLGDGGDGAPPQARLDIFLNPDEKARLQSELRAITDEYGRLALSNIASAEASLASAREAITGLLGDNDNGHNTPEKIEVKTTRPRNLSANSVGEDTVVDSKSACVLSLVQRAGSTGISRADLAESLRHNSVFNPKNSVVPNLVARVTFYLKKLKEAGLVENRGKTTTARWFALDGTSDQGETSPRTSARVTDDDNQQIVLSVLRRHLSGIGLSKLAAILCVDKRFNTQCERSGNLTLKVLHYLEKLQEQGLVESKVVGEENIWSLAKAPAGKEVVASEVRKGKKKKKSLSPFKLALLRLVGENDGILSKDLHVRALDYPELCGFSSAKISNHLYLLGKADLIVKHKGGDGDGFLWQVTKTGKKMLEKGASDVSEGDSKGLPKRSPPRLKCPEKERPKKVKSLDSSTNWEELILSLLRELVDPPTFDEFWPSVRTYGKNFGVNVMAADAFLENQVRTALLSLGDKGLVVIGEVIDLVTKTESVVDIGDENIEDVFEGSDSDEEEVPENPLSISSSLSKKAEERKKILVDDSSAENWSEAIFEAILEICDEGDTKVFSLEQLLDRFREEGGTKNWGISTDLDETDFEEMSANALTALERQNIIVMLEDQTWQVV